MKKNIITLILGAFVLYSCNNTQSNDNQATDHHQHSETTATSNNENTTPAPSTARQTPAKSEPAEFIPEFKFYKLSSGFAYEKSDIPAGKNTVFILFDPSCKHCQSETAGLAKNYDKIKDVNLFFVSMNDPGLMANFLSSFGKELDGKKNVELLYDRNQDFIQKFHIPHIFPANYVYGPDGKLKSQWEGEKDINEIIKAYLQ